MASPKAILATAILWIVEENEPAFPLLILFDMKYERFNFILIFELIVFLCAVSARFFSRI